MNLAYQLQQLAIEAQNYPSRSIERRKVLNNLVKLIQNSGQLSKQIKWRQLPNFEDIYQEALNETFINFCKDIDKYDSRYPVMAWVNHIFKWRFLDAVNKHRDRVPLSSFDEEAAEEKLFKDFIDYQDESQEDIKLFRDFVENDPEGILQKMHIRRDRSTNLQRILIFLCDGKEWKYISETLSHPIPTLSSFYQRSMKKHNVINYCRKYLQ
jgi:DNA-directed RNA polymerase specialized sigma24 family protein